MPAPNGFFVVPRVCRGGFARLLLTVSVQTNGPAECEFPAAAPVCLSPARGGQETTLPVRSDDKGIG